MTSADDQTSAAASSTKRPRWPLLLVMLGMAAAAGTVAALRGRRSSGPMLVDEPEIAAPRPRGESRSEKREFDRQS